VYLHSEPLNDWRRLAYYLHQNSQPEQAEEALEQALVTALAACDSIHHGANDCYEIACCYFDLNSMEDAIEWLGRALQHQSDHLPATLTLAEIEYQYRGQLDNAITRLCQAQQIHPDSPHVAFNLMQLYRHKEAWLDAIACLKTHLACCPDNDHAHLSIAQCHILSEQPARGIDYLMTLVAQQPDNYALQGLILCFLIDEEQDGAADQLLDAIRKHAPISGLLLVAETVRGWGMHDQALPFLLQAQQAEPDNAEICWQLAQLYQYGMEKHKKALHWYNHIQALRPDAMSVPFSCFLLEWGRCLEFVGRWDEAIECYQHCLHIEEISPESWAGIGTCLRAQHKYEEAIDAYRQALAQVPQLAYNWFNLGVTALDMNDYTTAVEALETAQQLNPTMEYLDENLARAYKGQGGQTDAANNVDDKAMAQFIAVIERDPNDDIAYREMGEIYLRQGKLDLAEELIRRSLEIDHRYNNFGWLHLGQVQTHLKQFDEAAKSFQTSIKINPCFYMPYLHLLQLDLLQNRPFNKVTHKEYTRHFQTESHCKQHLQMLKVMADIVAGRDRSIFLQKWQENCLTAPEKHWSFAPIQRWIGEQACSDKVKEALNHVVEVFSKPAD